MRVTSIQQARLVIPPGQEGVIERMLDVPAGLDDGWRFERATIETDSIDGYYRGAGGERARILLRPRDDAPEGWRRTRHFALGLAADPPVPSAVDLYRAILVLVRSNEEALYLGPGQTEGGREGADRSEQEGDPDFAQRARAAEDELDRHLDHTPFIELDVPFDHSAAYAEASALTDRFVTYQSDPTYGVQGWRGLALQALDGDASRVATTDDDAGVYEDQSRYRLTDVAERCPVTMSMLRQVLDFDHCRTVSFLMLEPGARIVVHVDGEGPPVIRSVNFALNMPLGCRMVIDCNPDGSDNSYTHTVPFSEGSVFLLNVAKYHYVVNESDTPRIHVVARGSVKQSVLDILARAEEQDGMSGMPAVEAALAEKRRGLRDETRAESVALEAPAQKQSEPPALSPFVSTLADAARDALLEVVEIGDRLVGAEVGPAAQGSYDWRGEVTAKLPSGDLVVLDFESSDPARPAWFRTARLACSYRGGEADPVVDPRNSGFFRDLRDRLQRIDPEGQAETSPPVSTFLEKLEAYRPFLPVQDKDFAILFHGADTPTGILWLGVQCNQDCRMCWQDRQWPAPPDQVFDRWLDELCATKITSLILSGGEPTLHPRLPEWIERAEKAGVYVTVETNAIRFTEPEFLSLLIGAGLRGAVVSLHSAEATVSDRMTMTPGSFALTVAGARAAIDAGIDVGIHCVVERANFTSLEAHAEFVGRDLSGDGRRISRVSYSFPIAYRRREFYDGAIVPLDELRPHLSAAVRALRARDIFVSFLGTSGFTPCAFDEPKSLLSILPESVSDEMRAGRTFVEPCADCSLRERCLGVHEVYVEQLGARGVEPVA